MPGIPAIDSLGINSAAGSGAHQRVQQAIRDRLAGKINSGVSGIGRGAIGRDWSDRMASQYPIVPDRANGEPGVFDIRIITDPDQELLDTLHPDIPPDMPVYVEVSLDGVPRGSDGIDWLITHNGVESAGHSGNDRDAWVR